MKEHIKHITKKLPRTREDWTFLFQLAGFIGNLIFCAAVLLGTYGKTKEAPSIPAEHIRVIVIDSTYAKDHAPVIFDNQSKSKK